MKIEPIKWYQVVSKFTPASCRYYPSCSEYAKWLFKFDNPIFATIKVTMRIARCNQLFSGGIDYPKVAKWKISLLSLKNPIYSTNYLTFNKKESKLRIEYWLIPKDKHFFLVKDFNATPTYIPARYAPSPTPK